MLFWRRRRKPKKQPEAFGTVQTGTSRLREFSGSLPLFKGAATHHLYCIRIGKTEQQTMLAEGFRTLHGKVPTHLIHCSVTLAHSPTKPRALFQLCLGLQNEIPNAQDWIAVEVAKGLKSELRNKKYKGFLIRCKTSSEFPWCIEDDVIDEVWMMDAGVYLRSALKTLDEITKNN